VAKDYAYGVDSRRRTSTALLGPVKGGLSVQSLQVLDRQDFTNLLTQGGGASSKEPPVAADKADLVAGSES
jgi:hypothetical protein